MAKITKNIVDKALRDEVFGMLINEGTSWVKINDRQYGVILTDLNGEKRYVRLGAIVAELRDDMTAEELMNAEIEAYQNKQAEKEAKQMKKVEKITQDKAKRAAEKAATDVEEVSAS